MNYRVIIERGPRNYSAYSPDLPGCVATGRPRAAVRKRMREAMDLHLEGLRCHGMEVPKPTSKSRGE